MAKRALRQFKIITSGVMTSTNVLTSTVTNINYMDNIGIQLNATGTPTGAAVVQVSMDYLQDSQGNVQNAGNWVTLVLSDPAAFSGAAASIYVDINQISAPWMRVVYTNVSGTGVLNAYICGKEIG